MPAAKQFLPSTPALLRSLIDHRIITRLTDLLFFFFRKAGQTLDDVCEKLGYKFRRSWKDFNQEEVLPRSD